MNFAEKVVAILSEQYDVSDAFGIPGGVIIQFIDALNNSPNIKPHLLYHEQSAGFAALGYAQATGKLGVAYATRGPGITNMITCIAEAYQESCPVLFITGHSNKNNSKQRFEFNQELNIIEITKSITKMSTYIDAVDEISKITEACDKALSGRKGPVVIDIATNLWNKEIKNYNCKKAINYNQKDENISNIIETVKKELHLAKRPVILIGDGVRQACAIKEINQFFSRYQIPILSSRSAQDIQKSENYFGYIGSHGCRYSNFILAKADLIIALGNRLSFPLDSLSYQHFVTGTKFIRIDIDSDEFNEKLSSINYKADLKQFIIGFGQNMLNKEGDLHKQTWFDLCKRIKSQLSNEDMSETVIALEQIIRSTNSGHFVCDVGNNEFWFARAFEQQNQKKENQYIFCSKSFGTLGVGIGKAIGVYYGTKETVTVVIGDQGFQYNLQDLQYISQWNLPINIVVVNNYISGMIRDQEEKMLRDHLIHVSVKNGYLSPPIKKLAETYGIHYFNLQSSKPYECQKNKPQITEIEIHNDEALKPFLPKGRKIYDMEPQKSQMILKSLEEL